MSLEAPSAHVQCHQHILVNVSVALTKTVRGHFTHSLVKPWGFNL